MFTMEERVLHHTNVLHRIGSAIDQMMERMDRWERSGLPTSSPAPCGAITTNKLYNTITLSLCLIYSQHQNQQDESLLSSTIH
jgi:hypothetical protein